MCGDACLELFAMGKGPIAGKDSDKRYSGIT